MVIGKSRCQRDDRTTHLVCGAPGLDRTRRRDKQPTAGGKEGMEDRRQKTSRVTKRFLKTEIENRGKML